MTHKRTVVNLPLRPTRRWVFVGLLALLAVFMTTSVFMANLVWVLLFANWLFEGRWAEKWQMARNSRLLHVVLALVLLLMVSLLWSGNVRYGLYDLQVKLPLLALPLVLLTTRPLEGRERQVVGFCYVATVAAMSVATVVRLAVVPDLPYREAVPFVSHIRFALNVCLVLCLLVAQGVRTVRGGGNRWLLLPLALLVLWFAAYVLIMRSYTAAAVLAVAVTVAVVAGWHRVGRAGRWLAALWLAVLLGAGGAVALCVRSYYTPSALAKAPQPALTPNGRPYTHRNDGLIENGNYINNYMCRDELLAQWPQRSQVPLGHRFDNGYELYPTLVRYLNAVGLPKDSVGVWSLTPAQVAQIERGVANPVYETFGLRRMVYVLLFDYENYRHFGEVNNSSLFERFELWRAGARVLAAAPWCGVGVGDVPDCLHARLEADGSALAGTAKHTHCQYLSLLMAFGAVGGALLLWLLLRALLPGGRLAVQLRTSPVMAAYVAMVLVSFCSEDTLETLAGILFCCFYIAFRHTPQQPIDNRNKSI